VQQTKEKYKIKDLSQGNYWGRECINYYHIKLMNKPFLVVVNPKTLIIGWRLTRQVLVSGLLKKDIESYGVVKILR
jgi:ATP-dependent DNA helicase RecQ